MPAIRAPVPRPSSAKRTSWSTHSGGRTNPEARSNLPLPSYLKNFVWSLQTAGASAYLAHCTDGAPNACGPLKAFACSATPSGVILSAPTAFMNLAIESTVAIVVGTHGSASLSAAPSLVIASTIALPAGSPGSAVRLEMIPYYHFGTSPPSALDTSGFRHSVFETTGLVTPDCW